MYHVYQGANWHTCLESTVNSQVTHLGGAILRGGDNHVVLVMFLDVVDLLLGLLAPGSILHQVNSSVELLRDRVDLRLEFLLLCSLFEVGLLLLDLLHFAQLLLHNQDGFPDTFWQNGPPDSSVR